jgi:hypothetical protein
MWTVPAVKSEHMELTRGSLIARETASYFFHVSESITHEYMYQVLMLLLKFGQKNRRTD